MEILQKLHFLKVFGIHTTVRISYYFKTAVFIMIDYNLLSYLPPRFDCSNYQLILQVSKYYSPFKRFKMQHIVQLYLLLHVYNLKNNIITLITFFYNFRENQTAMSFQYTLRNSVLEMKQSGTKGRLPSAVMRVMVTCVYRTENSLSCQSFVILHLFYGCRKVRKQLMIFATFCIIIMLPNGNYLHVFDYKKTITRKSKVILQYILTISDYYSQ